jgi:hypothetical protein
MFPAHYPAHQVFSWHCRSNNIPVVEATGAAVAMREIAR